MDIAQVRLDLLAEQADLDVLVAGLGVDQWAVATPSPGWTVADQIAHLAYFDHAAAVAITDPDAFKNLRDDLMAALASEADSPSTSASEGARADELTLGPFRSLSPLELLERWRANRRELDQAAASLGNDDRIEWYGPSMGSKSFLTARLMEAWAHGQDIADAVGVPRSPTDRLAHIARLGFNTRSWSYINRGLEPPTEPVAVDLVAPSGEIWHFGPPDDHADQRIGGPAIDFCLVVTQRRHLDDTDLVVTGDLARDWMVRAQAFAGGPTDGPPPGARPR